MILIRKYFVDRCKAIGLTEWTDAFNYENIPSNLINYSFFIESPVFEGVKAISNYDQEINCRVEVKFFIKGYRTPKEAMDKAIEKSEALLKEVLKPTNRLGQCLKNVVFNSVNVEPFAGSNDNLIMVTASFTAFTSLKIE